MKTIEKKEQRKVKKVSYSNLRIMKIGRRRRAGKQWIIQGHERNTTKQWKETEKIKEKLQ